MDTFQVVAILVTLTAICSYINYRYVHLHTTIGVMLIALVMSLLIILLGDLTMGVRDWATQLLAHVDFNHALLQWMLGALLFAGSLHVDLNELSRQRGAVALLATAGTAASMFIVAGLTRVSLPLVGVPLPMIYCLLFGALILLSERVRKA